MPAICVNEAHRMARYETSGGARKSRQFDLKPGKARGWDVLECPSCRSRMRVLSSLHSTEAIRAILECLGLSSRAPPIAPVAADPELDEIGLDSSSS